MSSVNGFSIYEAPDPGRKKIDEVWEVLLFLNRLGECVKFDDVLFGSDPPDFVIVLGDLRIALELTRLDRADFPPGVGDWKIGEHCRWDRQQARLKPEQEVQFPWGETTFDAVLTASRRQLSEKAEDAICYKDSFHECWLLLDVGLGNPLCQIVAPFQIVRGEQTLKEIYAKVLFEMAALFRQPSPFSHVILFYQQHLMAFTRTDNPYDLPLPDSSLLALGKNLPATLLRYRQRVSDLNRYS